MTAGACLAPLMSGTEELHGCVCVAEVLQGHHRSIMQAAHAAKAFHQLRCQLSALTLGPLQTACKGIILITTVSSHRS